MDRSFKLRIALACLLFLSAANIGASTTFTPQLTAGVGYSDNIQLQIKENEIAEAIFEVNPGFLILSEGRTHTLMAKYRLQNIFYSENSERSVRYNQLQSDVTKAVLGDTLFVDGSILYTQGVISPEYFYNRNSGASTGFFRDETYLSVSPYLKHTFDSSINSELRYKFDSAVYEKSSLDNINQTVSVHLDSMLQKSGFNWALDYSRSDIEYETDIVSDIRLEKSNILLQYRFSRSFALYGDIGYENNNYEFTGAKDRPVGRLWMSGFIWTPGQRTRLKIGAGKRFYGESYFLDIRHRSRKLEQLFNYNEDIVNISQVQSTIKAFDDTGIVMPPSFNALGLNADAYIRKRAKFEVGYDTGGNRIGIESFFEQMENQTNASVPGIVNIGSTKHKGVELYWKKRLTRDTKFTLAAQIQRQANSIQVGESQIKYSHLSIEHSLAKNASLLLSYSYADSKGPLINQNYIENYINSSINLEW